MMDGLVRLTGFQFSPMRRVGFLRVNRVQRRSEGCANWKYQLVEGWQTLGPA